MDPQVFGVYVVAFAVSLIGSSVQISLLTDPLVILGAPLPGETQSRYLAALLRLQGMVSMAVAACIGVTGYVLLTLWGAGSPFPMALAGVALSLLPIQLQIFLRAVFFARLKPVAVLWNDLLCSALRLAGLAILLATGSLSVFTVFLTWGIAAVSGFAAGLPFCRDLLRPVHAGLRSTWRQHWRYGRWMLATSGAHWCSGQAPALLASTLLNPAAAAVIKACQYFVAPLNVAFNGLDGVLAPRASKLAAARGEAAVRRFLNIFMAIGASAVALYGLLLLPAAPALLELLYKGRYAGSVAIVGVLLLDALFLALGRAPILRAKVDGNTRRIFAGYAWAAAVGLASLSALAPSLGVLGVAVAAPVSSATLLAYLMLTSTADRARRQTAQAAAQVVSQS